MSFKLTSSPNKNIQRIANPVVIFAKAKIHASVVKRWCKRYV